MSQVFGEFSFVIITSYVSSLSLILALIIQTLISKLKTDRALTKKETKNESN